MKKAREKLFKQLNAQISLLQEELQKDDYIIGYKDGYKDGIKALPREIRKIKRRNIKLESQKKGECDG